MLFAVQIAFPTYIALSDSGEPIVDETAERSYFKLAAPGAQCMPFYTVATIPDTVFRQLTGVVNQLCGGQRAAIYEFTFHGQPVRAVMELEAISLVQQRRARIGVYAGAETCSGTPFSGTTVH